jgi:hypothetical protein
MAVMAINAVKKAFSEIEIPSIPIDTRDDETEFSERHHRHA